MTSPTPRPKSRWTNEPSRPQPVPESRFRIDWAWLKQHGLWVAFGASVVLGLAHSALTKKEAPAPVASPSPAAPEVQVAVEVVYESPFYYVVGTATSPKECALMSIQFFFSKNGQRVTENIATFRNVRPYENLQIRELYKSETYPDQYRLATRCL